MHWKCLTTRFAATAGLGLLAVSGWAASTALLIGVGDYRNDDISDLPGIDNDVRIMTASLKKLGFQIVSLEDSQATKAGIATKMAELAATLKPGDHFIYYQSSHGTKYENGPAALLTHDTDHQGNNLISPSELRGWLDKIQAGGKTVLIDACFAGGLEDDLFKPMGIQRSYRKFAQLKYQRYQPMVPRQEFVPPMEGNGAEVSRTGSRTALFSSSLGSQVSAVFYNQDRGGYCSVYTDELAARLDQGLPESWQALSVDVVSRVEERTGRRQTPILSRNAASFRPFDAASVSTGTDWRANLGPLTSPNSDTAVFNVNPLGLNSGMSISPGTELKLSATAATEGWLFIIYSDTQGTATMHTPRQDLLGSNDVEAHLAARRFTARSFSPLDGVKTSYHDQGGETVDLVYITNIEDARKFANGLKTAGLLSGGEVKRGSLGSKYQAMVPRREFVASANQTFSNYYTAKLVFEVRPQPAWPHFCMSPGGLMQNPYPPAGKACPVLPFSAHKPF